MSRAVWLLRRVLKRNIIISPIKSSDFARVVCRDSDIPQIEKDLNGQRLEFEIYAEDFYRAIRNGTNRRRAGKQY